MTLIDEIISDLGNPEVLSKDDEKLNFRTLTKSFPFHWNVCIDWKNVDDKFICHQQNDIEEFIAQKIGNTNIPVFVFFRTEVLCLQVNLKNFINALLNNKLINDYIWAYSKEKNFVIEIYNCGECVRIGKTVCNPQLEGLILPSYQRHTDNENNLVSVFDFGKRSIQINSGNGYFRKKSSTYYFDTRDEIETAIVKKILSEIQEGISYKPTIEAPIFQRNVIITGCRPISVNGSTITFNVLETNDEIIRVPTYMLLVE